MKRKITRRRFLITLGKTIAGLGALYLIPLGSLLKDKFSLKIRSFHRKTLYEKHDLAG